MPAGGVPQSRPISAGGDQGYDIVIVGKSAKLPLADWAITDGAERAAARQDV